MDNPDKVNVKLDKQKILIMSGLKNKGDNAIDEMITILKDNKSIEKLEMSYQYTSAEAEKITDEGAKKLATFLESNTTVKHIKLAGNKIKDGGVSAIAESLKINKTLKKLDICQNLISADGANALIKALEVNNNIIKLRLVKYGISAGQGVGLGIMLFVPGPNLYSLARIVANLSEPQPKNIGGSLLDKIAELVERNKKASKHQQKNIKNIDLAGDYLIKKDYEKATEACDVILKTDQNNIKALLIKAKILHENARYEEALSICEIVIALDKICLDGFMIKLSLLQCLHKFLEAKSCCEQILEIDSQNKYTLNVLRAIQEIELNSKHTSDIASHPREHDINKNGTAKKEDSSSKDKQENVKSGFREVKYSELEIDEKKPLGSGTFAIVYKGKWNNKVCAIKKLHKHLQLQDKEATNFLNEMKLMSQLNNSHIIRFYAACTEVGNHCIVMEYCELGSLNEWLKKEKHQANDWPMRLGIAADIGKGLMYLHKPEIDMLHRDLKSSNVLLVLLDNNFVAKITDFGLSKTLKAATRNNSTRGIKGTIPWVDPEIFQGKVYSKEHDIYSYGMVLWEIYTRKEPYEEKNDQQIMGCKWKNENETFPIDTPIWYKELVNKCWSKEIATRPNAGGVVKALIESTDYPKETISNPSPDKKRQDQLSTRLSAVTVKPAAADTNSRVLNDIPPPQSTPLWGSRNNLYRERPSETNLEARNKSRTTLGSMPEEGEIRNVPKKQF